LEVGHAGGYEVVAAGCMLAFAFQSCLRW
jgi:hypothetical protein